MKPIVFTAVLALTAISLASAQEILAPLSSCNTLSTHKSNDTTILQLPFFDDFSDCSGTPNPKRWTSSQAFVNDGYAPQPPTIGVVTLDALNQYGDLYPQASTNLFPADTIESQTIRLDSITGTAQRKLEPSDSVYISFFVLPGGWYGNAWELVGDSPSMQDSLFLDFYSPIDSQWVNIWSSPGYTPDTTGITARWPWKFVSIPIDDLRFFHKDFRFRFHNFASLDVNPKSGIAGNCDQWNLDYIYLNYNRNKGDSIFRDIAFVDKAPSMLSNYYAMPSKQFTTDEMATHLNMRITNRYNQTLSSNYSYKVTDENGIEIASYNGGMENIRPFFPSGYYQDMPVHAQPPVEFSFPSTQSPAYYTITHIVTEGVSGDIHSCNDTTVFVQSFDNFYAYDDGVPENGYGLTANGSHQYLALRFDMNVPDTLTAVDLYFNRTRNNENDGLQFYICVWQCENRLPGTLIYKDSIRMETLFDGMNCYHRYRLSKPILVRDSIFVGFEQLSNDYINIGFDRNNNSCQRLFYRTGNDWQQSILRGSVMMRPAFGNSAIVGISPSPDSHSTVTVFPNPANSHITISASDGLSNIRVYDMHGRQVYTDDCIGMPTSKNIQLLPFSKGIYILHISIGTNGSSVIKKLIVK